MSVVVGVEGLDSGVAQSIEELVSVKLMVDEELTKRGSTGSGVGGKPALSTFHKDTLLCGKIRHHS